MTAPRLDGTLPDGRRVEWGLDSETNIIGREPPSDLVLALPRISRQHVRITCSERCYYLTDLNSRNGTYLNGQRVGTVPLLLSDGDEIVLGGAVTIRFSDPSATVGGPRLGRVHGIWVDEEQCTAWVDARLVDPPLSAAQFALLVLLYRHSGKVVNRAQVIAAVWPEVDPHAVSEEAVDGLVKRLRRRLRETQPDHDYIVVLRGHGMRLNQPEG